MGGILSFFAGMILEVLNAKDKKDFEYRMVCTMRDKKQLEQDAV